MKPWSGVEGTWLLLWSTKSISSHVFRWERETGGKGRIHAKKGTADQRRGRVSGWTTQRNINWPKPRLWWLLGPSALRMPGVCILQPATRLWLTLATLRCCGPSTLWLWLWVPKTSGSGAAAASQTNTWNILVHLHPPLQPLTSILDFSLSSSLPLTLPSLNQPLPPSPSSHAPFLDIPSHPSSATPLLLIAPLTALSISDFSRLSFHVTTPQTCQNPLLHIFLPPSP